METDESTLGESAAKIKSVKDRIEKALGGCSKSTPPPPKKLKFGSVIIEDESPCEIRVRSGEGQHKPSGVLTIKSKIVTEKSRAVLKDQRPSLKKEKDMHKHKLPSGNQFARNFHAPGISECLN